MTVTALRALGMAEARKSLERVTFAYSDCVARSFVSVLVTRFYALSLIDFTGCSNLCDVSIATVAVNCCENLIGLTVRCCPRLTSSSVRALAGEITIAANQTGTRCAALRSLDLSSCLRITAIHGVGRLRRLRFLSLSNLPDLVSSKRFGEEVATLTVCRFWIYLASLSSTMLPFVRWHRGCPIFSPSLREGAARFQTRRWKGSLADALGSRCLTFLGACESRRLAC